MEDLLDKAMTICGGAAGVFIIAFYFFTQIWGYK